MNKHAYQYCIDFLITFDKAKHEKLLKILYKGDANRIVANFDCVQSAKVKIGKYIDRKY